jgi:hypothetical protein
MQLTSTVCAIRTLLSEAVADFQNHRNVNTLCEQVKNGLLLHVEAFLVPVIEKLLCDPQLMLELKVGAGKMGLRFNAYRPSSIRLLTGNALKVRSPYFSKTSDGLDQNPKSATRAPDGISGSITSDSSADVPHCLGPW